MATGQARTPRSSSYLLVATRLRASITEGTLRPGTKLPSEAELARHYGLSRSMIRRALTILAEEQLIDPVPQRGWFVN